MGIYIYDRDTYIYRNLGLSYEQETVGSEGRCDLDIRQQGITVDLYLYTSMSI